MLLNCLVMRRRGAVRLILPKIKQQAFPSLLISKVLVLQIVQVRCLIVLEFWTLPPLQYYWKLHFKVPAIEKA